MDSGLALCMLSGELPDYTGAFAVDGSPFSLGKLGRRPIDFVLQDMHLISMFTAVQNIFISDKALYRMSRHRAEKRCRQLLEELEVDLDICKPVNTMSSEEQKMVEILRLYKHDPPVAVFYETLNNLSAQFNYIMPSIFQKMKARGEGIVYITSKFEDALKISDRISVIDNGTIKKTFETKEVQKTPREIMYLLSGWETLKKAEDIDNLKILESIVNAREIMTSSYELKKVLKYLASDIARVLNADNCIIYLIDESLSNITDSIDYKADFAWSTRLKTSDVLRLVREGEFAVLDLEQGGAVELEETGCKTILVMPVIQELQTSALIQVSFKRQYTYHNKDKVYLITFGKEVSIAIETSRLMGRSTLLQESHHRIKNNLQMIVNLMYMQKSYLRKHRDADISEAMDVVIRRIKSIATVHNLLSNEKLGNSIINLKKIAHEIVRFYVTDELKITMDIDNISIPYGNATSISLVINELIGNSVKHAFQGRSKNHIHLECINDGLSIILTVRDNGWGMPEGFDIERTSSIGLSIVKSIVAELKGAIYFQNAQQGAVVQVVFPMLHVYNAVSKSHISE